MCLVRYIYTIPTEDRDMDIDVIREKADARLWDECHGNEDAPEDTRGNLRKFLDEYSDTRELAHDLGDIVFSTLGQAAHLHALLEQYDKYDQNDKPHLREFVARLIGELVIKNCEEYLS